MRQIRLLVMAASMLFLSAGCNVFEPFYEAGSSDDPEVLLDDARYALQNGEPDKAVAILEKAFAVDSSNAEVRVELAAALFLANGIDVLVMKDLAEFITESSSSAGKHQRFNTSQALACSFAGNEAEVRTLHFEEEPAYLTIVEHSPIIDRVMALVDGVLDNEGNLSGNTDANRQMTRAIANLSAAIKLITRAVELAEGDIYSVGTSIGYCAPTQEALDAIETAIVCGRGALHYLDNAAHALGRRQQLIDSDDTEFVDLVQDLRDEISATVSATCDIDVRVAGQ